MSPGMRLLSLSSLILVSHAAVADETVEGEITRLLDRTSNVEVIELPATGSVLLDSAVAVTVDKLRDVVIDDNPPAVGTPPTYPWNLGDGVSSGSEPYIAQNIAPFRFNHFQNEWKYAGWYTWEMEDYALAHGFDIGTRYANRVLSTVPVADSEFTTSHGFSWNNWFASHLRPDGQPYAPGRWDQLPARSVLTSQLLGENQFPAQAGVDHLELDLEGPAYPLTETDLRAQTWYPAGGVNAAFEDDYYDGYIDMTLAAVETAKTQGWSSVGIYGWTPFQRIWFGTESAVVDPATHWAWNRYGKEIYNSSAVDVIYPSVYNFYWDDANVAYTLAQTDLNLKLVNSEPVRKPVRPYFWNQLHGGGGGWRWWQGLPVRNEDVRAMIAMNFFTGDDGMVLWSWSGSANPHVPDLLACRDLSVRSDFTATAEGSGTTRLLKRYDAIHVLEVSGGVARFQVINPAATRAQSYGTDRPKVTSDGSEHRCWQSGDPITYPVYSMSTSTLSGYLRAATESIQPLFEGLTLARALEYTLYTGTVKIDVSSQQQFANKSPIVRRVDNGDYMVVAAYDPQWELYPAGRTVTLTNFDGHAGLTVQIPVDKETRLYILKQP